MGSARRVKWKLEVGGCVCGEGERPARARTHAHTRHLHIYASTEDSPWRHTFSHTLPARVGLNHMQDFSGHATSSNQPESVLSISHASRLGTPPSHAGCQSSSGVFIRVSTCKLADSRSHPLCSQTPTSPTLPPNPHTRARTCQWQGL